MPPDAQSHHVHSTARLVLVALVTFLFGSVLALCLVWALAHTSPGEAALRGYFSSTTYSSVPTVNPSDIPAVNQQLAGSSASTTILVPKAYASQEYYFAINKTVADFNGIVVLVAQLQPLLVAINAQASSGDYSGILDRISNAKAVIAQSNTLTARFAQDISTLSAVSQNVTDAVTKVQTQTLVIQGGTLQTGLAAYFSSLGVLLSGATPSAAQIDQTRAQSKAVVSDLLTFKGAAQSLIDHFAAAISAKK